MKKLSLLLLTLCISLANWAATPTTAELQTLNPYAYNLSASWDVASSILNVSFTLNEHPNTNQNYGGTGIQIFAVDPSNNNKLYYIYGVPESVIIEHKNGKTDAEKYHYNLSIPINGFTWDGKEMLPTGKTLKLAVRVQGMNVRTEPTVVADAIDNRPYSCHGVSVNNDSNSPDFGNIYVTEASEGQNVAGSWYWIYEKGCGRSVLEYTPRLYYNNKSYQKNPAFSPLWNKRSDGKTYRGVDMMEPHRVRVSEDGRIFVSSYNVFTSTDGNNNKPLVWELNRNTGEYTPLITFHKDNGYGHRVVGIAVKGKDSNLKVALCFLNITNGLLTCCEYNIGTSNSARYSANKTLFTYQLDNSIVTSCKNNNYYFYSDGLISIAYGVRDNTKIYLGYDYFWSASTYNHVVGFNANGTQMFDKTSNNASGSDGYYGGGGITVYRDEISKRDMIVAGRYSAGGRFSRYKMNEASTAIESVTHTPVRTTYVVNDFAFDCANNMYIVSFLHGQADKDLGLPVPSDNGAGRLIAVAMPYGGTTTTMLPDNFTLTLSDPVPNILATDLRYEVNNANEYIFSFNTNTQPEYAELRFYKSYESMKQSLAEVNADDFDGDMNVGHDDENLVCYYPITKGLKQGKISVTLGGVGGTIENKVITNDRLPAGELYWSVYVQTRKSSVFAPIYRLVGQTQATEGHERKHATVNNYPETDGFGNIIVAHNPSVTDEATRANRGLHIYGLNPDGNSNDEQANINNNTRYSKRAEYLNENAEGRLHYPRRLAVGPDGKIYIADEGSPTANRTTQGGVIHEHGGVKVWDPANPNKFALFSDNRIGTATGVALYDYNGWKLYANNTYNEFSEHGSSYTKEKQDSPSSYGWNGFVRYTLDQYTSGHNGSWAAWGSNATEYALRRGDASGNFAFAPMEKGIWICQYREHTVALKTAIQQPLADNIEAYVLSFVPYGTDIRTWKSSESIGVESYSNGTPVWDNIISPYSQTTTAPLQSTPGGGVAYKKTNGKEYVYVVNHDGNIAVLEITGWTGTGVSATPIIPVNNIKILTTPEFTKVDREVPGTSTKWHTAYITSMCFDYAGNLITTTGKGYHDAPQDIIVYTMPYDRTNAREIQAPNSCRMIPERLAYLDMSAQELELVINNHKDHDGCAIELFRPLQAGMFNTICLPFELDFANLPNEHPFKDAKVRAFTGATLEDVGGEKVLSLVFSDITQGSQKIMSANVPYLLEPVEDIVGSVRFDLPLQLTSIEGKDVGFDFDDNHIDFRGVLPITPLEATYADGTPLILLLVADNRLAALTSNANILGFRAYFQLAKPLPAGTSARIVGKKPVTTNTTIIVDGKKVNVEKFLREGRVYIRVGETLYNMNGEIIER